MTERKSRRGHGALIVSGLVCLLVAGCAADRGETSDDAPSWAEAANASYEGIHEEPVQLQRGSWEGPPFVDGAASRPRVGLISDFRLTGDLDGDGAADAAVLLWENSGGTGTFTWLAALIRVDGAARVAGIARVGDRIQVRSAGIEDGTIRLDVIQGGDGDAACCPGQKVTRSWRLGPEGLSEQPPVDEGRLGPDDLAGVEWVLRSFGADEPAPAEPKVVIRFEDDRIAGTSGCNNFFASVEAGDAPGTLSIGPMGTTMMACPDDAMALEQRVQRVLGAIDAFGFEAGRLSLTAIVDDEPVSLWFDGRALATVDQ